VSTLTFGVLHCFFVIAHDGILHCNVTRQRVPANATRTETIPGRVEKSFEICVARWTDLCSVDKNVAAIASKGRRAAQC
jgi:hypothetical protein